MNFYFELIPIPDIVFLFYLDVSTIPECRGFFCSAYFSSYFLPPTSGFSTRFAIMANASFVNSDIPPLTPTMISRRSAHEYIVTDSIRVSREIVVSLGSDSRKVLKICSK